MIARVGLAVVLAFATGCPSPTLGDDDSVSTTSTVTPASCDQPEAIPLPGDPRMDSGWVRCEDGVVHRASIVACAIGPSTMGDCTPPSEMTGCLTDEDCSDMDVTPGFCVADSEPSIHCSCNYACTRDDECQSGEACFCNGPRSTCIPASCLSDADCPGDHLCRLTERIGACGDVVARRLACTSDQDECRVDADCNDPCMQCLPSPSGPATCTPAGAGCFPCG